MSISSKQIIQVVGYGTGGVIAVVAGEYITAAKAFALAISSLVDPETAQQYLTAEGAERQQLIADVAEVAKFGALS